MRTTLYRHFDEQGTLLYVGISNDAIYRLKQHAGDKKCWVDDIASMTIERFATRSDAMIAEKNAIKNELPKYNIVHNVYAPSSNGPKRKKKQPIIGPKGLFDIPKRYQFLSGKIAEVYRQHYEDGNSDSQNYHVGMTFAVAQANRPRIVYEVIDILFDRFVICKSKFDVDEPHFRVFANNSIEGNKNGI